MTSNVSDKFLEYAVSARAAYGTNNSATAPAAGDKDYPSPGLPINLWQIRSALGTLRLSIQFSWAVLLIGALSACATDQGFGNIEHGFYVDNRGTEPIKAVVISYGELRLPFCDPHCLPKRGGGGWNAPMPIEEEMQVTWQTADGRPHLVRMPVRSKIKDLRRLSSLDLHFYGDQLTVLQGLRYTNPGIVGLEFFPLFPNNN